MQSSCLAIDERRKKENERQLKRQIAVYRHKIKQLENSLGENTWSRLEDVANQIKLPTMAASSVLGGVSAIWVANNAIVTTLGQAVVTSGMITGVAVGGALSWGVVWINKLLHEKRTYTLGNLYLKLLEKEIDLVESCGPDTVIDLVFNKKIYLTRKYAKAIKPVNADHFYKKIMRMLQAKKKGERPVIKKMDFSQVALSYTQLRDFLSAGLGRFRTVHLILCNNALTNDSIAILHEYIVKRKSSFQQLKRLDLSCNQLTKDALGQIVAIAKHVMLESLNLSQNKLSHSLLPDDCQQNQYIDLNYLFLRQASVLPTLKRLYLRDIGLNSFHQRALTRLLANISLLELLDIRKNPDLTYPAVKEVLVKKGLKYNVSLKVLRTDHDMVLPRVLDLLERRAALFASLGCGENNSRLISLLNLILQKKIDLKRSGLNPLFKNDLLCDLSHLAKRLEAQKEAGEKKEILISEVEFVSYQLHSVLSQPACPAQDAENRTLCSEKTMTSEKEKDRQSASTSSKEQLSANILLEGQTGLKMCLLSQNIIIFFDTVSKRCVRYDLREILKTLREKEGKVYLFSMRSRQNERIALIDEPAQDIALLAKEKEGEVSLLNTHQLPLMTCLISQYQVVSGYSELTRTKQPLGKIVPSAGETLSPPRPS